MGWKQRFIKVCGAPESASLEANRPRDYVPRIEFGSTGLGLHDAGTYCCFIGEGVLQSAGPACVW